MKNTTYFLYLICYGFTTQEERVTLHMLEVAAFLKAFFFLLSSFLGNINQNITLELKIVWLPPKRIGAKDFFPQKNVKQSHRW